MFSRRSAWPTTPSTFAAAIASARAQPCDLLDLTNANPTALGLIHPPSLYTAVGDQGDARYQPASRGLPVARAAIAEYYRDRRQITVDPSTLCLCAGTSEAYSAVLSILADPGDAILVPRPSYPLLGTLADLAGLTRIPYSIAYDGAWHVDLADLRRRLDAAPRARAILVVAPNNPTGNYLDRVSLAALESLAAARSIAVIVDEVFFDYPLAPHSHSHSNTHPPSPLASPGDALTFTISGLSKIAALPQMKLAWTAVSGPPDPVREALARLEIVHDTYLSASTPIQRAAPALLGAAPAMQARILARLRTNLGALARACGGSALTPCAVEGGWTALVRLPKVGLDDLEWALRLLDRSRVLTQPGYLYDLEDPHLALSLLTPPTIFARGVERLVGLAQQVVGSGP